MSRMKIAAAVGAGLLGLPLVGGLAVYGWASMAANAKMDTTYELHRVEFAVPFALADAEVAQLRAEKEALRKAAAPGVALASILSPADTAAAAALDAAQVADPAPDVLAGVDLNAIATERAVARGKHLVEARYACGECHGQNFGGGTMVDDPMIGRLLGPNLTLGKGSKTLDYKASDWDRLVRHGVKPSGHPTPMPSKDFFAMSDRELSDIISYIRSLPPVDNEQPPVSFGPLGTVLLATGNIELSADVHPTHHAGDHLVEPPAEAADATFGGHITKACTGCHRADFSGGPIMGGPPDWPPAANLTQANLGSWKFEDFKAALREGKKPDGTELKSPMKEVRKMADNMSDTELQAMWAYLQTVPAAETGK